jgi:hypothetical protein
MRVREAVPRESSPALRSCPLRTQFSAESAAHVHPRQEAPQTEPVPPPGDSGCFVLQAQDADAIMVHIEQDMAFLKHFRRVHNTYFTLYMNPPTQNGPYQTGESGKSVDIAPACKFLDPEFHSGKNFPSITEVARRIQAS